MAMSDKVGCWFSIGKDTGIIRYYGPVAGTSGQWFGVEWSALSQPLRGKHSGTHNDVRYFRTQHPRGGSFIRPLLDRIDFGQSLLAAVHERYLSDAPALPNAIDSRNRGKLEAVGFDKIRREQQDLSQLRVLGLDSLRVNGAEDDLYELRNVETLRLSGNYLTKWAQVDRILEALAKVAVLDLSANHFESPVEVLSQRNVDAAVLDSMPALQWADVVRISEGLSAREVSWGWSQARGLESDRQCACLEDLGLEYNEISDIAPLARQLPSLRSLNLRGNRTLASLPANACFQRLASLNLRATGIKSWSMVELLNGMAPQLTTLHLYDTPLQQQCRNYDECRANVVARLERLQKLDGTEITDKERTEMERYYLVLCARHGDMACGRRAELVAKHGQPATGAIDSGALKSRLVQITLQVVDRSTGQVVRTHRKQLIRSMALGQLRPLMAKLAGTRRYQIHLGHSSRTLDWDKELGSLLSNDVIHIEI